MSKFLDVIAHSKIGRRLFILFFYVFLMVGFLYISKLKDYFFPANVLCVYTFVDIFHPKSIAAFEQKFKTKVVLRYFESNEELLAKFMINRGQGYDVIVVSDYMVELLCQNNLLQQLDHKRLPILKELDARLMNQYYDSSNKYSLPLCWIPYGVLFDKKLFSAVPTQIGLHLLFDNPSRLSYGLVEPYKICMPDDAREAILLASLYLFGNIDLWSEDRLKKIQGLLIDQKRWVESYVNHDLAYPMLSGLIKVAVAPIFSAQKVLKSSNKFSFVIPKEGSIFSIENLAIPRFSRQVEQGYAFINFMLTKEETARMHSHYGMNPSNKNAFVEVVGRDEYNFTDQKSLLSLHSIKNDLPLKIFEEIWLAVKSA